MKKKNIILGLLTSLTLFGCVNDTNKQEQSNSAQNYKTVSYVMTEESEDVDINTKKLFDMVNKYDIDIKYIENAVYEVNMITEYDYSNGGDDYVEELYKSNKEGLVDSYNKESGVNMSIDKKDKVITVKANYVLKDIDNNDVKDYIHINCGLDPEKYNDDGTYPLSDLEKALEEKGFTKES